MTQAVVFDIGNVLLEWNPERFFDARIGAERRAALFRAVDLHAMNLRVDAGAPFHAELDAMAQAHPDWRDEILLWRDNWLEMASPEIPDSVALLRALRARGTPVFALSNFGNETLAMADSAYPFLADFDRRFISGEMGVLKPDPEIYRRVETETGLPPGALLFIDDKPENTAAAAARGWQTHLFDGPRGLSRRLVGEGLLTEEEAMP